MTRDEFELYNRNLLAGKKKSQKTQKSATITDTNMMSLKDQLISIGTQLMNERNKQFTDSNEVQFKDIESFVIKV